MTRRSAWIAVIGAFVLGISVLAVHALQRNSAAAGNIPGVTPAQPGAQQAAMLAAHGAFMSLFSQVPAFQNVQFGSATRTISYRDTWSVNEGYVAADGSLYVAVTPKNDTSDVDDWHIGLLEGGSLRLIMLPPARNGYRELGSDGKYHTLNYGAIVFNSLSSKNTPVVTATDYDGTSHLFRVYPSGVVELPYREVPDYIGEFTLSSGERCLQSTDPGSDVLVTAIDSVGRQRALLTRQALIARRVRTSPA